MKILTCILLLGLFTACETAPSKAKKTASDREEVNALAPEPAYNIGSDAPNTSHKMIGGAGYTAKVIPALDFLQAKGEKVSAEDKKFLEKEVVVMLEIASADAKKDFFDAPGITFSKEESLQYLTGNITQDVTIIQGTETFYPSGSSYERSPALQNRIRVMLFFSGVDVNKKMKISYYDRILDAGIINFGINNIKTQ